MGGESIEGNARYKMESAGYQKDNEIEKISLRSVKIVRYLSRQSTIHERPNFTGARKFPGVPNQNEHIRIVCFWLLVL